jgi:CRP/FNR family transcriptional regulator, cyclic AMP receptor protein
MSAASGGANPASASSNPVSAADLAGHAFLRGLPEDHLAQLAQAAAAVSLPAGYRLFEEGGPATRFWLITSGHVALDLHVPGRPPLIVETIGAGEVVGLSWAALPHEWQYGAEAVTPAEAFEMDATSVLGLCDADPVFGYQLTRRLVAVAARRLHSGRIRMLDLYGSPSERAGLS